MVKKTIAKFMSSKDLDAPILEPEKISIFRKNKIRCIIIYEDGRYEESFQSLKDGYSIEINQSRYIVVPKAIMRGKYPTMYWYYNNPMPIWHRYTRSTINSLTLRTEEEIKKLTDEEKLNLANITIDAQSLKAMITSSIIKNFYHTNSISTKQLIIIAVIVLVVILMLLQMTGQVDVLGYVSGSSE